MTSGVAFVGAPYDGAATLGWPGARYAPEEVRRQLAWMRMRVQDGQIYWVDEDREVPWRPEQLIDAGDAAVVPHDLVATLAAAREKTRGWTRPALAVVGGDDSILFPAVAGVHDAVRAASASCISTPTSTSSTIAGPGTVQPVERHAPRAGAAARRARHSVQVGTRSFNFPSSKRFIDEAGLTELPARHGQPRARLDPRADPGGGRGRRPRVPERGHRRPRPAHAPGVGWHEPGGLTSGDLIDMLVALAPAVAASR